MDSPSYNAWKLVSLSPLPAWALGLLVLGVIAGVVLAAVGVAQEPARAKRWTLYTLRLAAGLAALFFLFEPGLRKLQVARLKNRVAVLVDRSASMGFPTEPNGPTRAVQVADYLRSVSSELEALSEKFTVEIYGFDPELEPLTLDALRSRPPQGARTDLLAALKAVKAGTQGSGSKKLSGILLFSDGADNGELVNGAAGKPRAALTELEVPVTTFTVGSQTLKDLAIDSVKVDDFAFVRNSMTVEVDVSARGFAGQEVPLVLTRESHVVASKGVKFTQDNESQHVSFTFTPDQTGRFVYSLTMPVFPEETVKENNVRSFSLKVIRDRIRVLLVVGRPSWDERFLRGLLRQDANVDLVSFYILRTLSDDPQVRNQERELSLIPFPMDEIFDKKLDTFDVVIFQNFGYTDQQLSVSPYEQNLENYVRNGGAFAMIGGDRAFGEGKVSFPTLGKAIPVEPSGGGVTTDNFRARLTPEGQRHPVTALGNNAATSEAAWRQLPEIPGANLTRLKPGAVSLLDHPFQTVEGKNVPILALWDYGRGRALALMTDASWYWAFTSQAQGQQPRYYDRLWSNALRWLTRDPDLTTLKVTADPPSVEPGRPVGVIVGARNQNYEPAAEASVHVELVSVKEGKVIDVKDAVTGSDGSVRVEFGPPAAGAYKLMASAKKNEQSLGQGEDAVAVRAVGPELSDASVRFDVMENIAKVTGGKSFQLPRSGLPSMPLLEPPSVEVGRSKDQPLWDRWYYLVGMIALMGAEWFLRRRFGYI